MNSSAHVHYNEVLSGVAIEFRPPAHMWGEIFKRFPVVKESDVYAVMDRNAFEAPQDDRADGAESNVTRMGWKYDSYQCREHALHTVITKRMRDNAKNEVELEGMKTRLLKQQVHNNIEKAVFGSSGILRTAANNGSSVNGDISNLSTGSPRLLVQTGIDAVELACGLPANTIALATNVLRHITRTAEYRDETKHVANIVNDDLPTELYGLRVIKVGAQIATTNKGQSKTPTTRLMGEDVWIGYVNPAESLGDEMVTYGACITADEYADMWYEKNLRGDKLEYGMLYDLKLVARECGYLATSVLTA
jgi:hypothetical protein